jgi:hypothetical protein
MIGFPTSNRCFVVSSSPCSSTGALPTGRNLRVGSIGTLFAEEYILHGSTKKDFTVFQHITGVECSIFPYIKHSSRHKRYKQQEGNGKIRSFYDELGHQ